MRNGKKYAKLAYFQPISGESGIQKRMASRGSRLALTTDNFRKLWGYDQKKKEPAICCQTPKDSDIALNLGRLVLSHQANNHSRPRAVRAGPWHAWLPLQRITE